jgi:hypothetical protein
LSLLEQELNNTAASAAVFILGVLCVLSWFKIFSAGLER